MLRLDPVPLHRFQQTLIFLVFWEKFSPTLSFPAGIALFLFFTLAGILLDRGLRKVLPFLPGPAVSAVSPFILLLIFPVLRLFIRLSLPGDLFFLSFYNNLLPVLPWVILFRFPTLLSARGRFFNLGVAAVYGVILTILMSRSGWMIELPFGKLSLAYLFYYIFILNGILLILSGGEKGGCLSGRSFAVLLLIPLLVLVPVSRNYSSQSKKESGGLLESSLFRFDFSDYLSLESSISMKDDLVFMMKKEGQAGDFMVRRFILPEYSLEKGFYRIPGPALEAPGRRVEEFLLGEDFHSWDTPEYELTESVPQEYYLVNFDSSAFLGMNSPESVTPYQSWSRSSFSRIYRVDSRISTAWGWDLMDSEAPVASDAATGRFLEYYTEYGGQDDLRETAQNITDGIEGYYEKVEAIEFFLKDNYYYSLHPGTAEDGDQLRHFLYDGKKGYCSYFAFSMALLCRSIGIPARVSLGFWVSGSSNVLNYYPVKANQAHAWVEVFFPGFGWIEFDPTSQTPAPGEEYLFAPLSAQEVEPYLREILENRDFLQAAESAETPGAGRERSVRAVLRKLATFPGVLMVLSILILLFTAIRIVRLILFLNHPPLTGSEASLYFRFHLSLTESLIQKRDRGESPREYGLRHNDSLSLLEPLIDLYEKIRFGWSSRADLETLYRRGRELRAQIRNGLTLSGRLKYFIHLIIGRVFK